MSGYMKVRNNPLKSDFIPLLKITCFYNEMFFLNLEFIFLCHEVIFNLKKKLDWLHSTFWKYYTIFFIQILLNNPNVTAKNLLQNYAIHSAQTAQL